jgi:hypothetical protein
MAAIAVVVGLQPVTPGAAPSGVARAEIPALYLRLYQEIGARYGIDPWILAGIGYIETQHGTSTAPGVHSGRNIYGCCAGPMQISLDGSPSTWNASAPTVTVMGACRSTSRRTRSPPRRATSRLLAPRPTTTARCSPTTTPSGTSPRYSPRLTSTAALWPASSPRPRRASRRPPRVCVRSWPTVGSRSHRVSAPTCARAYSTRACSRRSRGPAITHAVVITALKSDHSRTTVDGNVSNHSVGRAMDIGAVDGEICRGTHIGRCADLVREYAAVTRPLRSTELIYCWAPDGPADPRGFARADHCDHIHWGMDG